MTVRVITIFLVALAVISGTALLVCAALLNRVIPFGFGFVPAAIAALVLGVLGAQRVVRRMELAAQPPPPILQDVGAAAVVLIFYFLASTAVGLVMVLSIGFGRGALYLPTLLASAVAGVFVARLAAKTLLGVSRSWMLFASGIVCAVMGLLLAISARAMTSDWLSLVAQQGVVVIAAFWMLAPEPVPQGNEAG